MLEVGLIAYGLVTGTQVLRRGRGRPPGITEIRLQEVFLPDNLNNFVLEVEVCGQS